MDSPIVQLTMEQIKAMVGLITVAITAVGAYLRLTFSPMLEGIKNLEKRIERIEQWIFNQKGD